MKKIYYVMIKGRMLESRDIKHLLARAVAEKRNIDKRSELSNPIHRCVDKVVSRSQYRNVC
jgi:hypothetical protein